MIPDYLKRMITEKEELEKKLVSLGTFTRTKEFRELPQYERSLLLQQRDLMEEYKIILQKRIEISAEKENCSELI